MIVDANGVPIRRRIGFLLEWDRPVESKRVDLVSAVGFTVATEDDEESE